MATHHWLAEYPQQTKATQLHHSSLSYLRAYSRPRGPPLRGAVETGEIALIEFMRYHTIIILVNILLKIFNFLIYLLFIIYFLVYFFIFYLLFIVYYFLFIVYYLLFIIYCLLFIIYCLVYLFLTIF